MGSFYLVPDFLAVRGLAALILLAGDALLNATYMNFEAPAPMLKIFVYVMIVIATVLGASPYKLRDFFEWLYRSQARPCLRRSLAIYEAYSSTPPSPTRMPSSESNGILLIVSGPAGSGKTTVCDRMLAEVSSIQRVVTSTTRPPREGEQHIDYYFFDHDTFAAKVQAGDFYEHANVHTNRYGTLKSEIHEKLAAGKDLLLNIDVQGAATFAKQARLIPI